MKKEENQFLKTDYIKNWKHRGQGLAEVVTSGIFLYEGLQEPVSLPLIIGGTLLAIDGVGDAITSYHHYCGQKVIEGIKYINRRIKNE